MPFYRCFFVGVDRRISGVELADQPDDGAAYSWGAELLDKRPMFSAVEVWHRDRIVCRHERGVHARRRPDQISPWP
jgi:hypothetical protein